MQLILQHFNIKSLMVGPILHWLPLHMTLSTPCWWRESWLSSWHIEGMFISCLFWFYSLLDVFVRYLFINYKFSLYSSFYFDTFFLSVFITTLDVYLFGTICGMNMHFCHTLCFGTFYRYWSFNLLYILFMEKLHILLSLIVINKYFFNYL